jgi:hypothetical protein
MALEPFDDGRPDHSAGSLGRGQERIDHAEYRQVCTEVLPESRGVLKGQPRVIGKVNSGIRSLDGQTSFVRVSS